MNVLRDECKVIVSAVSESECECEVSVSAASRSGSGSGSGSGVNVRWICTSCAPIHVYDSITVGSLLAHQADTDIPLSMQCHQM